MGEIIERATLSVQQPWAWLIVNNFKPVENRSWATKFRGVLNIHAGRKFDADGYRWVRVHFPHLDIPELLDVGGIVGTVEQHGCVTHLESPWFFGPYGHLMRHGEPCELIPCRGQLGYFAARGPQRSTRSEARN